MSTFNQLSFEDQMDHLVKLVKQLTAAQLTPKVLQEVLMLTQAVPEQFIPKDFSTLLSQRFNVDQSVIDQALSAPTSASAMQPFDDLVPRHGWLPQYMEYTKLTEPPSVFHFFAGLTIIGVTISRRVYFPRGNGDLFPNLNVVLVAPPGKCKKTTACNLAVNLFRRIGGNVLADKITPEAIIESFQNQPSAQGLIYAPEWSVFLGKQQYMEGLVPMLTALFDCPAVWSSTTIMRGTSQLQNVALSHLAATTIDWMQSSITKDAFAGGFMSRLLFIVQKHTERSFPLPPPLNAALGKKLTDGLLALQHTTGAVGLTAEAERYYISWYDARQSQSVDKHFAGYFERKPDRLLQLGMLLNASFDPKSLLIDRQTLEHANRILGWIEHFLPGAFEELSTSVVGDDQIRLMKQLRKAKGELSHSEWLRLNTARMNSVSFKACIETLKQAKLITFDPTKRKYYLLPAGKAMDY